MTQDDIIRMAREAGSIDSEEVIETVWRAFSAAEREACAKVCDDNALKVAALAQQAEQAWVCPDSPEHRYAKPGHCEDCGKTLVQEQGCDHCNHPLYAATKCRVCGRVTEQAEPVEPVAWMYTGIKQDGTEHGPHLVWKPEYMDAMSASKGAKATPLYTASPKRPPLTEEEIDAVWDQWFGAYGLRGPGGPYTRRGFARAVERAHNITDTQIEDRLARHGIPMPEGDPK